MRRFFAFIAIVTFFLAATAKADEGLALHYTFVELSAATVDDVSGNGQTGQIHGTPRLEMGGGHALVFDGKDDYLEVPDSTRLRSQNFTIEVWVKPESSSLRLPIVSKACDESGSSYLLDMMPQGTGIYCTVLDAAGSIHQLDSVRPLRLSGKWSHIALTCDRRWVRGYVDGVLEVLMPLGILPLERDIEIPYSQKPLHIGRSVANGKSNYFRGKIADIRIYDRVLSAAEVEKNCRQGNTVLLPEERPRPSRGARPATLGKKSTAMGGPQLYLIKNGTPTATIVIPAKATYWTRVAAEWLRDYVRKATDVELEIVSEDQAPAGTLISVGHTALAAQAGISATDLKYDGCKMTVKGNVLYLIGRNVSQPFQNPEGNISDGNCRAAVTLLEDFCGVRWFLPGPEGEFIPKASDISVPTTLNKRVVPAIAFSNGRFPYGSKGQWLEDITPAAVANNFRIGMAVTRSASYERVVPPNELFEEHPEYFALIDGTRTAEGNHLCSTNPEVKHRLVKALREQFELGYDVVALAQEDGYRRCECAECEKLDDYRMGSLGVSWEDFQDNILRNTPCERLFFLHKQVIDEVHKSHPDGVVLLHSYGPTTWPSKKIDTWDEKVWIELTKQEPEVVEAWKGKGGNITGYVYWFNIQIPMGMNVHITPDELTENMRYLHDNGFVGVYGPFPETNWGLQGPSIYLLGRLMGDPYRDPRAIVEEYCRGVFGKAAGAMLSFFDELNSILEERLPFQLRSFSANPRQWAWLTPSDIYLLLYPPETIAQLENLLMQAEIQADTERSRGWVKQTREFFDCTKLITNAITAYRMYQRDTSEENWLTLKSRVEAFEVYRARIVGYDRSYTDRWFPGHQWFANWLTADNRHETVVYYTPWEQRKTEVLEKGMKGMGVGYLPSGWRSWLKEPFTLDFSKEPPK